MLDDSMTHLPATRPAGVEVLPGEDGLVRVKLWGRLPLGWPGALSGGLSAQGISILSGFARRMGGNWEAELQVRSLGPQDASAVDYLALAVSPGAPGAPAPRERGDREQIGTPGFTSGVPEVPIVLEKFTLERSRHVGSERLLLDVWGEDCVGFLGSLLGRLAGLSLFPEAMAVETRAGAVVDSFTLRAIGGLRPTDTAEKALVTLLQGLVRPRTQHGPPPLAASTRHGTPGRL